ncbi:hypothetical protein ACQ859_21975 [Roseateles chitinivorans]|uniref:hypothetical protein n=1 Tax=Roseateles chitinivorans TaxID=2917965 RepID=UPI003D67273A
MSRQQNVQQQNALAESRIRSSANHWRMEPWPPALLQVAKARGVDCDRAIVIRLEIDFAGMPRLFGQLLTSEARFIYFEMETDARHIVVQGDVEWNDVTDEQNLSSHNRGTGAGLGAIALRVLEELNARTI